MSANDFDSAFVRFAENMHRNSEQEIIQQPDFLQMQKIDIIKAEQIRLIFGQYLPWGQKYMEQYPKSEVFASLLPKVIAQGLSADNFIEEFTSRAFAVHTPRR